MLTEQRKTFVNEYIKLRCKNAKQAAINAGYSSKTAHSQASNIMKDNEVLEYLNLRKSQLRKALQEEFIFDALEAKKVMYGILKNEYAKDADRLNAAKDFLDRAGFKAPEKLDVNVDVPKKFSDIVAQIGGKGLEE